MRILLALLFVACVRAANPYTGNTVYLNPYYQAEVAASVAAHPSQATTLTKVANYPTFIWIDKVAVIGNVTEALSKALAQQKSTGKTVVTQFVIYDLPNRDCAAAASNGEFTVADNGLYNYEHEYIDPIAAIFAQYPSQPIVAIIEPDSLANLATNLAISKCSEANTAYRDGVAYAIDKLYASNVYMYLDAAHECWLGWDTNLAAISTVYADTLARCTGGFSTGVTKIRGFATNVANYCNTYRYSTDPDCGDYNYCYDESTYITKLVPYLSNVGITSKYFLIDTSRNGQHAFRSDTANWCNCEGAGLGARPAASPDSSMSNVDAYVWVKPPGESDGTSDSTSSRYDYHCGSSNADATTPAPEAGTWFDTYFVNLCTLAVPSL